ncbi:YolD-like family protein [Brevibacillus reuszeri]|uniref:YolD-like family protein n=1 Tax=Brevibacillus reuszeri TaxID=54915 RepID=UPI00289940CA|nr:YolD-like family protein [Brevibacillus reuszeri]
MASKKDDIFGSMRFVLPEHRVLYVEHLEDEKLVSLPILEEDEMQEINSMMHESIHSNQAVRVNWWRSTKGELGIVDEASGWVQKIDMINQRVKLMNQEEVHWINMNQLLRMRWM